MRRNTRRRGRKCARMEGEAETSQSEWERTGHGGTRKGNHALARAKMPAAESIPAPEQE
jgi:hypothetical protein